jgi:hypothetical protein
MTDTMRIWDKVSKTNPANTKKVSQRGGFTSICAQSQIMEATRAFGPLGEGWGYSASLPIFHDNLVFVQVTLWHGARTNEFGPVTGGAEWKVKDRVDSDAAKKATTDAVTKLLSQLGFNADVFLGLFDDSKYVAEMEREFAPKPEVPASVVAFLDGLTQAYRTNEAESYWTTHWPAVPKDWRPYALEQKEQIKVAQSNVSLLRAG